MILVSLGMLGASIGVYTGSAAGSLTASKWSTSQETSMSLSANFSGTTTIEDKQNEGGRQVTVVPEKLRTLDHGRPWSDDQFASTRLSSNRDMSR